MQNSFPDPVRPSSLSPASKHTVQWWSKRWGLDCANTPERLEAVSRNLGLTFFHHVCNLFLSCPTVFPFFSLPHPLFFKFLGADGSGKGFFCTLFVLFAKCRAVWNQSSITYSLDWIKVNGILSYNWLFVKKGSSVLVRLFSDIQKDIRFLAPRRQMEKRVALPGFYFLPNRGFSVGSVLYREKQKVL